MSGPAGRLGAILDSLRIGVLSVDAEGRVELQNTEASRILGLSGELMRGRTLEEALGKNHPAVPLIRDALRHEREVSAHACALPSRLGNEALTADLAAAPLQLGGDVDGAVLTLRDRTIGRELEALVDQRARSELFGQLAEGVAHEIRNPLGGIRGAAELLLGKLAEEELRRYPQLIRDETDRILRLLDDLAQLTRGGELRLRRTNLHRVLDDLIELQHQAPGWTGIEVHREYDPSIPELDIDADRITQVFLNLMRNAVQAMEGRGELTLRTRMEARFQISPGQQPPLRMVRIDVDDTGPGIGRSDLPHVFTPFFTRKVQGTGLGLPVAQHWVVRHGGQIQILPRKPRGTRVRVQLPVPRSA